MRKRILALLVASCSTTAMAQGPGWTISESSGPVRVAHAGITKVATRGSAIAPGDVVTTGAGGRAVLVRGPEYMMVAPASQLRLPSEEQATGFTRVIEDFGNVVFMIKKKLTPHFEVKTPYLAAVVKGTTFTVGVTPAGASVQVLEGAVDVATGDGGAHELLRPGAFALVGANNIYRMQVQADGITRTLDSPAMPQSGDTAGPVVTAPAGTGSDTAPASVTGAQGAPPIADLTPAIETAVYEVPVSLAATTGGLVNGSIGGANAADILEVASAARVATEASTATVKAVKIATQTTAADRCATGRHRRRRQAERGCNRRRRRQGQRGPREPGGCCRRPACQRCRRTGRGGQGEERCGQGCRRSAGRCRRQGCRRRRRSSRQGAGGRDRQSCRASPRLQPMRLAPPTLLQRQPPTTSADQAAQAGSGSRRQGRRRCPARCGCGGCGGKRSGGQGCR